jgi:hypothetical protein
VPAADDIAVFWDLFITQRTRPRTLRPTVTDMSGPTFNYVRRQFGIGPALAWSALLWRWGLVGAGVRSHRPRARYARRRSRDRAMSIAQWIVLAIVGGAWIFWAFLMVKGVIAYTHAGH